MSEIIKIALLGIAGVLFAIQFRQQRPEYALLIGFALSVLVFSYVLGLTGQLLEDAGIAAVSDQIEILGKLSVLFAGLPILLTVIRQIYGIL